MTQRLPSDIDRMLWEIAESQDTNAYDDFEKRFPHLVGELGKRIQLVRELRDARGSGTPRSVPRFDRRDPVRLGIQPRALWALGGVAIACLGIAAYSITGRLVSPPKINQAEGVPTEQVGLPVEPPLSRKEPPRAEPDNVATGAPPKSGLDANPPPLPAVPAFDKPQELIRFEKAKLKVAILAVATTGKLDVEFAPNMPNPDIRMEYRGMSPLEILKDLGPRFGFTAFKEGGNRILLVPAVDRDSGRLPPATGSGYAASIDPEPTDGDNSTTQPKKVPSAGTASSPT